MSATTNVELTEHDIDALPLTQYLVLDCLAGRARLGESVWTFQTRTKPALRALEALDLVNWFGGVVEGTVRAQLTPLGRSLLLSDSYVAPRDRAVSAYTIFPTGADPQDDPSGDLFFFTVRVERRSNGRWAVVNRGRVLNSRGKLVHEPPVAERGKKYNAKHRFDRETALDLARDLVDKLTVMGQTWPQYHAAMTSAAVKDAAR